MTQALFTVLIGAVALERVAELVVARRNAQWAFARGGREVGFGHYPVMVVLHTALLVGALAEVWLADRPFVPALGWTDRKSTRLNSSHVASSYAVFCLKKKSFET